MKVYRTLALVFVLALIAGVFALPAAAQDDSELVTYTLTEQEINDSFRVNNPRRWRVSDLSVDLKPGEAMIMMTYEFRGGSVSTTSTVVPTVENGRVYWAVTDVVIDGSNVSDDLLEQLNTRLETAWRNYFRSQTNGYVVDVDITETEIIYTLQRRASVDY